jgi:hypothetical protein
VPLIVLAALLVSTPGLFGYVLQEPSVLLVFDVVFYDARNMLTGKLT